MMEIILSQQQQNLTSGYTLWGLSSQLSGSTDNDRVVMESRNPNMWLRG